MFNEIAPTYDFLNRLLSLRRDVGWRKKAAKIAGGGLALDVCVRATVLDALGADLRVGLIRSATRAVDPQVEDTVVDELRRAGAAVVD